MIVWMRRMMVLASMTMLVGRVFTSSTLPFFLGFIVWMTSVVMLFILFNRVVTLLLWILSGGLLYMITIILLLVTILVPYSSTNSIYGGLVWAAYPVSLVVMLTLLHWRRSTPKLRWYLVGVSILGYPGFYCLFMNDHGTNLYSWLWGPGFQPGMAMLATIAAYLTVALQLLIANDKQCFRVLRRT